MAYLCDPAVSKTGMGINVNTTRIWEIDLLRGILIVGVVIFHLLWNLESYGFLPFTLVNSSFWWVVSRMGAIAFLVIVGMSLQYTHAKGFRWRKFTLRVVLIALCATIVSLVTYLVDDKTFIYFGILHLIATGSLLAAFALRFPSWVRVLAGVIAIFLPHLYTITTIQTRNFAWSGLTENAPDSLDFYPLFPWVGWVFLGSAVKISALSFGRKFSDIGASKHLVFRYFCWSGQNSLVIYVLHQPVLFGLIEAAKYSLS